MHRHKYIKVMPSPQFSTVLHKRNATPGAFPTTDTLSAGEIAINSTDAKLFIRTVNDTIETFLSENQIPYKLNSSLSAIIPQYGTNVITQVLSNILGGYLNDVAGAASTIANGESNSLSADFGFIGSGAENTIGPTGDFSAILGGHHNLIAHSNSFVLGSNLSSHAPNFTYVNNISGTYYGDGSNLTGIVSPIGIYLPLSGGFLDGNLTVNGLISAKGGIDTGINTGTDYLSSYKFYGDGVVTSFDLKTTVPQTNPAGYIVSLNGATQVPYQDYTISYISGTNKLDTLFVPPLGCELSVVYLGSRITSVAINGEGRGSAKAYVRFDGSTSTGVLASSSITSSYNISSVNKTDTGSYTITFSNALSDSTYVMTSLVQLLSTSPSIIGLCSIDKTYIPTVNDFKLRTGTTSAIEDCKSVHVVIM